jgi:TPR repeat protein
MAGPGSKWRRLRLVLLAAVTAVLATPALADVAAGIRSYEAHDYAAALKEFATAADAGDAEGRTRLAIMYLRGEGTARDPEAAVKLLQAAAEDGYLPAQFNLARAYYGGVGVERDAAIAATWFTRAAEAGDVLSAHALSVLYHEGTGVEKDLKKAAAYARQAADRGLPDAQYQLAVFYYRGDGVPQDLNEAYYWFLVAWQQQFGKAREFVHQIRPKLADDVAEAIEERAVKWQPVKPAN